MVEKTTKKIETQQPVEKITATEQVLKKTGSEKVEDTDRTLQKQMDLLGNSRFNELKYSDNLSLKQIKDFKKEMLEQGMSKGKVTDMCKELYNTKSENDRLKHEQIEHEHQMELLNMKQEWQQAEIDREKAVRAERQLERAEKAAEKMARAAAKLGG